MNIRKPKPFISDSAKKRHELSSLELLKRIEEMSKRMYEQAINPQILLPADKIDWFKQAMGDGWQNHKYDFIMYDYMDLINPVVPEIQGISYPSYTNEGHNIRPMSRTSDDHRIPSMSRTSEVYEVYNVSGIMDSAFDNFIK